MADADGSRRPSQPSTPVSPAGVGASASNRGSPRAMVSPSILQEILESGDQPLIDDALEQWDATAMGQLLSTPRGGRWGQWGRRQQWWILVVRFLPQPTQLPLFRRNLGKKKWHPDLACPCTCTCTRPRGRQYPARTAYTSSKGTTTRTGRTRPRSRSRRTRPRRTRRTSSPSQPVALPSMDIPQPFSTRFPSNASQSSRFATTVTPVASRPRSHCGRTTHCQHHHHQQHRDQL